MYLHVDENNIVVAKSDKKHSEESLRALGLGIVKSYDVKIPIGEAVRISNGTKYYHQLTGEDGNDWAGYKLVQSLEYAKDEAHEVADVVTIVAIESGHDYAGQKYSLSANAQMNLLTKMIAINAGIGITYPIVVNTQDDAGSISLKTKEDFIAFFVSAMDAKDVALDVNVQRKAEIRAAKTVEDLKEK